MTFPSGAPGGYPGQGPQQSPPGPGYGPPPGAGLKLSLTQILALVAGGLGVLILFLGFAPVSGSGSGFYASFDAWVPAGLFIGGLLQAPAILPGDKEKQKTGIAPAAVTLGITLGFLFQVFSGASLGAGGVMVLIFSIIQSGAAVTAYLFETGLVKPPAPNPYGHGHGGYPPPPPSQPGFPQTGGFPAQQQTVQQPGFSPGQQTTFAPQQGQFGQPGTPPGGYPQQQPPQY
ncbi:DUF5336 domain-containing protein [Actinocrispum sp. NPDC049592]|uniref:DUF5336 domain-containing protein n=1 Tax=Actinocrispum sp. NPDC049592 TaxID=3154835 RepID=UPI0034168721